MDKKSETVSFRLTAEEKEAIKYLSDSKEHTMSFMCHRMLLAAIGNQDLHCAPRRQGTHRRDAA